jgi:hypothetical protein
MINSQSSIITYKKCIKCGEELKYFSGYIPEEGEACMKCWVEHMKREEIK